MVVFEVEQLKGVMSIIDVKGFNRWQEEILVIDHNLNGEVDPSDEFIILNVAGLKKEERVAWNHPRFKELREEYLAFLKAEEEELALSKK